MPIYTYVRNADPANKTRAILLREGALKLYIGTYANITLFEVEEIRDNGLYVLEEGIIPPASNAGTGIIYSTATIVPNWEPLVAYIRGQAVLHEGSFYTSKLNFESSETFEVKNWNAISSSGIATLEGDASGKSSENEVKTVLKGKTPATLKEGKLELSVIPSPNAGGYYEATFGNNSATTFVIEHKLNTLTPDVVIVNQSTSLREGCNVKIINANKVELSATAWTEKAPGVAAYRVSVDASSGLVNSSGSSLTNFIEKGEIGANNGVGPLNSTGKLPASHSPGSEITDSIASMYRGGVSASNYENTPLIKLQDIVLFGSGRIEVTGQPQGHRLVTKYLEKTTEEPAQSDSVATVLPTLTPKIVQEKGVTGNESDVLIQGTNEVKTIAAVGHAFRVQAQNEAFVEKARALYVDAAVASGIGSKVNRATGLYIEDPRGSSLGTVVDVWALYSKNARLQLDGGMLWFGTYGEESNLIAEASEGATKIITSVGSASKFNATNVITLGAGAEEEVKVIESVTDEGESGVAIKFSSGIAKKHPSGAIVKRVDSMANLRNEGAQLKTDGNFKCGEALVNNAKIQNTNGNGYAEFPDQSGDPPTPSSAKSRLYWKSGEPYYKTAAGTVFALKRQGLGLDGLLLPIKAGGDPTPSAAPAIGTAFKAVFQRCIVEAEGKIKDISIWNGATVNGNSRAAIFDVGESNTGNYTVLWEGASIEQKIENSWQSLGTPELAVAYGQHVLFAIMNSGTTGTYGRAGAAPTSSVASKLPANYLPVAGGAEPKIIGTRTFAELSFGGVGAKITEAQLLASASPCLMIGRVA